MFESYWGSHIQRPCISNDYKAFFYAYTFPKKFANIRSYLITEFIQFMHIIIALGAIAAMLSVVFGAMGAHLLQDVLSIKALSNFQKASDYQMYHGLATILAGISFQHAKRPNMLRYAAWLFIAGIILFSGSLYLYSLTGTKTWAMVTPFGGTAFIFAWLLFAMGFLLPQKKQN